MKPSVLITNGLLFSGSADDKAAVRNVLIEDGMIKRICSGTIDAPADADVIDATGKWITPGFIDSHTHYDAELIASPGLKESARHGVTSILLGSCSVSAVYNFPFNLISFSDAGAHLRNMAFYSFPLQMIKNVQDTIDFGKTMMSMEKCIWRLTGEQVDWFGIDCGYVREGRSADLNIIDPTQFDAITEEVKEAPIEEFDNYPRLVNRHPGVISQVLVGGETIYRDEEFVTGYGTKKKFGRFLKKTG